MSVAQTPLPPLTDQQRQSVQREIGQATPFAKAIADDFFGPAVRAGAMTHAQAMFLASGPFLMPCACLRSARIADLDEGFVFMSRGGLGPGGPLPGASRGLWLAGAMELECVIEGERLLLDRDGIRRWSHRVDAVVWPEGSIVGIVYTEELRAWTFNVAAAVPALTTPRTVKLGPPAAAARRAALWRRLDADDRRQTWATINLEDLAGGGHALLEGLVVPGGRIRISPFTVPPDPMKHETEASNVATYLRQLDGQLGKVPSRTIELDQNLPERIEPPSAEPDDAAAAALSSLQEGLPRQQRKFLGLLRTGMTEAGAAKEMGLQSATGRRMFAGIKAKASKLK